MQTKFDHPQYEKYLTWQIGCYTLATGRCTAFPLHQDFTVSAKRILVLAPEVSIFFARFVLV